LRPERKLRPFAFGALLTQEPRGMSALSDVDVLIVDDHAAMRELLRKVLERAGATHVRDAASGAEALAALEERAAGLVLVDQNMPGMSGGEFIAALRGDARWSGARVMLLTGDVRAEAGSADMLLVKPVSPRELLAAIERLLQ
jgi:CheY-like chemotaxis protein